MSDHYFTPEPASAEERRPLTLMLAGRRVTVTVSPGVFSPGGLDKGTRVLLDEAPEPPEEGTFLDLGCGWGAVALTLGLLRPDAEVWAVDVNERALDLARMNALSLHREGIRVARPDQVPPGTRFDVIWSNPPIRIGKEALHDLLATWLPRLAPAGAAYLVVSKNLGADTLRRWVSSELGMPCERVATSGGFRVLRVARG